MHQRDEPGCGRLTLRILRLANNNDGWWPERRKSCQKSSWELAWTRIEILGDLREFLRRRRIIGQELRILCHQQKGRRYLVPVRPDLVLDSGGQPVELPNPDRIIGRKPRGTLRSRGLPQCCRCQQEQNNQGTHDILDGRNTRALAITSGPLRNFSPLSWS